MANYMTAQIKKAKADFITSLIRYITYKRRLLIALLLLLCLLGYTVYLSDNLFPGSDNARFLVLAQSLISGQGYRKIALASSPHHTLAPPGFPMLLTPVLAIFGNNIRVEKVWVALFAVLTIPVVYLLFKREYSTPYAIGLALIYATTPVVFMYARRVYSDLPFTLTTLLALIMVEEYTTRQGDKNLYLIASAGLLGASYYLRSAGLVLIIASIVSLLIKKHYRKACVLLLVMICIASPWAIWRNHFSTEVQSYSSAFLNSGNPYQNFSAIFSNLGHYARYFAENLWYISAKAPSHLGIISTVRNLLTLLTIAGVSVTILLGIRVTTRRHFGLSEIYFGTYMLMLASYSYIIDRFIIVIVPFIIHYYLQGLSAITQYPVFRIKPKTRKIVILILVSGMLLSNTSHIIARLYQETHFSTYSPVASDLYEIAKWARDNTSPNEIVITDDPYLFYVYAERQTVTPTQPLDVDNEAVRYIVVETAKHSHIATQLGVDADHFFSHPLSCGTVKELCIYAIPNTHQSSTP